MKKILLFGINKKIHTIKRIIKELERKQLKYDFVKWGDLVFSSGELRIKNKKIHLDNYDAAFFDVPSYTIVKENTKLEGETFFRLTSEFHSIANSMRNAGIYFVNKNIILKYPHYDKFCQSQIFFQNKIPTIPTIHLSDNKLKKAEKALKNAGFEYPVVIKKSRGGMGLGVFKVDNISELESFLKDKRNWNLIYQPYIENNCDFRVFVCGGKSLGVMKRVATKGTWKNNFALGGSVDRYMDTEMEKFAEDVCKKIGFNLAGVDVIKSDGKYIILEVNAFPCFEGFESVYPEVNVAEKVVKIISKNINDK